MRAKITLTHGLDGFDSDFEIEHIFGPPTELPNEKSRGA